MKKCNKAKENLRFVKHVLTIWVNISVRNDLLVWCNDLIACEINANRIIHASWSTLEKCLWLFEQELATYTRENPQSIKKINRTIRDFYTFFCTPLAHSIAAFNMSTWHNFPKTSSHTFKTFICWQIAPLNIHSSSSFVLSPFFCVHKTSSLVETKNKSRDESGCGYRKTERERERQVQIHSQTIQFDSAVYLASGI